MMSEKGIIKYNINNITGFIEENTLPAIITDRSNIVETKELDNKIFTKRVDKIRLHLIKWEVIETTAKNYSYFYWWYVEDKNWYNSQDELQECIIVNKWKDSIKWHQLARIEMVYKYDDYDLLEEEPEDLRDYSKELKEMYRKFLAKSPQEKMLENAKKRMSEARQEIIRLWWDDELTTLKQENKELKEELLKLKK